MNQDLAGNPGLILIFSNHADSMDEPIWMYRTQPRGEIVMNKPICFRSSNRICITAVLLAVIFVLAPVCLAFPEYIEPLTLGIKLEYYQRDCEEDGYSLTGEFVNFLLAARYGFWEDRIRAYLDLGYSQLTIDDYFEHGEYSGYYQQTAAFDGDGSFLFRLGAEGDAYKYEPFDLTAQPFVEFLYTTTSGSTSMSTSHYPTYSMSADIDILDFRFGARAVWSRIEKLDLYTYLAFSYMRIEDSFSAGGYPGFSDSWTDSTVADDYLLFGIGAWYDAWENIRAWVDICAFGEPGIRVGVFYAFAHP